MWKVVVLSVHIISTKPKVFEINIPSLESKVPKLTNCVIDPSANGLLDYQEWVPCVKWFRWFQPSRGADKKHTEPECDGLTIFVFGAKSHGACAWSINLRAQTGHIAISPMRAATSSTIQVPSAHASDYMAS